MPCGHFPLSDLRFTFADARFRHQRTPTRIFMWQTAQTNCTLASCQRMVDAPQSCYLSANAAQVSGSCQE